MLDPGRSGSFSRSSRRRLKPWGNNFDGRTPAPKDPQRYVLNVRRMRRFAALVHHSGRSENPTTYPLLAEARCDGAGGKRCGTIVAVCATNGAPLKRNFTSSDPPFPALARDNIPDQTFQAVRSNAEHERRGKPARSQIGVRLMPRAGLISDAVNPARIGAN